MQFLRVIVLIEPYWNVNENNAEVSAAAEKRINRTILECKSEQAQQIEQNKTGINRTILECKYRFARLQA